MPRRRLARCSRRDCGRIRDPVRGRRRAPAAALARGSAMWLREPLSEAQFPSLQNSDIRRRVALGIIFSEYG